MELGIRPLELRHREHAEALVALQRAAYTVEAELIGFAGIPAMRETVADVANLDERVLGRFDGERLLGAVGYLRVGTELELCRLVIDPAAFRAGHASALLDAVDAAEPGVARTTVSTGASNTPALALYGRRGFRVIDVRDVAPGVAIARLERSGSPATVEEPAERGTLSRMGSGASGRPAPSAPVS